MSFDCACGQNHRDEKFRDFHSKTVIAIAEKWKKRHSQTNTQDGKP